ncbi:4Fe-4S dicluster domain-containing protein [Halomonas sp. 328]|uniref:4Fe-4S dicluster domain-containing protein n=1 Tax=Halomonas sp. 328 TaxID=2776704 RepID=UPI0018A7BA22|nr:4Fe-4S dicluster domain-containing protein [Halomonas sp. 328]MBF8221593.1 4Fe-4S dicluster domain-containing protein [Halomonas sp. 328]
MTPSLTADDRNRLARESAYRRVSWPRNLAPASVTYASAGHALLIGNEAEARRAARLLEGRGLASLTLLLTEATSSIDDAEASELLSHTRALPCHALSRHEAEALTLEGYLGRFRVGLYQGGDWLDLARALAGRDHFDLILDLGRRPRLDLELPPPGYLASRGAALEASTLADWAALVGEFDKPRYFEIDADLCAHDAQGKRGCSRCLEVCPADAIASQPGRIAARVEIDPFRCHGVGSCTSACPTGAIRYRLPEEHQLQQTLAGWLEHYRQTGGRDPVVRFATAADLAEENVVAGQLIDLPLEELGSAGHEQWLAALAFGAAEVRIQYPAEMPERLRAFLNNELALAHGLLAALELPPERIRAIDADPAARDAPPRLPALEPLTAAPEASSKRERLNLVLDHLAALGGGDDRRHALPHGAAYGGIRVDNQGCTLCLACVSACPTPALAAGQEQPALSLREADCVQCGLCEATCPEQVITLEPGFLAGPERSERRTLHQAAPFHCISCGKAFASAATIEAIKGKLAAHPYFAGEAAQRLEMCEDCRVRDVWRSLARDPEAQLKV